MKVFKIRLIDVNSHICMKKVTGRVFTEKFK